MAKVILINGSPRADQCTATALDEMVKPLLSFNLGNIRLENDKELAKNAIKISTTNAIKRHRTSVGQI